jgi:hypothetical protein
MLDRRMNDRGKMWRHVYKAHRIENVGIDFRHYKFLITAFTVVQKTSSAGGRIIYMSSNHFENSNISMMMGQIRVQTVQSLRLEEFANLDQFEVRPKI